MASVGLLYVGAVLFLNGLMLLGYVDPKAAGVFNLFVGALQVITPTVLIIQAGDDVSAIAAASGIYLFGFTYLYVGIGLLTNLANTGVGWFSLFVAIVAVAYAVINAVDLADYPFAVIWLMWSFLWTLFFLLLGLGWTHLAPFVGWVAIIEAWITCVVPAFLLLTDRYRPSLGAAVGLAAVALIAFVAAWRGAGPKRPAPSAAPSAAT